MLVSWIHVWPTALAAFLASLVEFVEALTVVLAVGVTRGWRGSLTGALAALVVLIALIVVLGPALVLIPIQTVQLVVGALLILFGMRWLRKAILRSAGIIALHDEDAAFDKEQRSLREAGQVRSGWDKVAIATSFKITMLEGIEVVFIVIAIGAGGANLLVPATIGALAALACVVLLGLVIHRPLSRVPENQLKFVVGVLLTGFGIFWFGEGIGIEWPGADWAILGLSALTLLTALVLVPMCRRNPRSVSAH